MNTAMEHSRAQQVHELAKRPGRCPKCRLHMVARRSFERMQTLASAGRLKDAEQTLRRAFRQLPATGDVMQHDTAHAFTAGALQALERRLQAGLLNAGGLEELINRKRLVGDEEQALDQRARAIGRHALALRLQLFEGRFHLARFVDIGGVDRVELRVTLRRRGNGFDLVRREGAIGVCRRSHFGDPRFLSPSRRAKPTQPHAR